ncbi:OmpA family protein [Vibrio sp. WXL103]|uniref:OmpA family protein n=1 Tax=Vibrio sp. WXL103 TaxID=3450710 RepID=UPI003EC8E5FD
MSCFQLDKRYYLLGFEQKPVQVGFDSQFETIDSSSAHKLEDLVPLPMVPLAVNLPDLSDDEKSPDKSSLPSSLWGSNAKGELCNLSDDPVLPDSAAQVSACVAEQFDADTAENSALDGLIGGSRGYFNHSSPIHTLTKSNYHLVSVPLETLAGLAPVSASRKELLTHLKAMWQPTAADDSNYTHHVVEVEQSQLRARFEPSDGSPLSDEQRDYNAWRDQLPPGPLKAIVMPAYTLCAVTFSHSMYRDAKVSLHRYEPGYYPTSQEEIDKGSFAFHPALGSGQAQVPRSSTMLLPVAMLKMPPLSISSGFYTLRVQWEFDSELDVSAELEATSLTPQIADDGSVVYQYDLREYLTVNPRTSLGQLLVVRGDMVNLEESLVAQFPDYLRDIHHYLQGDRSKSRAAATIGRGFITQKHMVAATFAAGDSWMTDAWKTREKKQGDGETPEKISALSVAQRVLDAINDVEDPLPPSVRTGLDLYYGGIDKVKSVGNYIDEVKAYHKNPAGFKKKFGLGAFINQTVYDAPGGLKGMLEAAKTMPEVKEGESIGYIAKSWYDGITEAAKDSFHLEATLGRIEDFFALFDNVQKAQLQDDRQKLRFEALAGNYLEHIPAWHEDRVVNDEAFNKVFDEIQATLHGIHSKYLGKESQDQVLGLDKQANKRSEFFQPIDDSGKLGIKFHFFFNSWDAEVDKYKELFDHLKNEFKYREQVRIVIEGHACPVGTPEQNYTVSKRRAEKVKAAFGEALAAKITTFAKGSDELIYTPEPEELDEDNPKLAVNRRVVIKFYIPEFILSYPTSRTAGKAFEMALLDWTSMRSDLLDQQAIRNYGVAMSAIQLLTYTKSAGLAARGLILLDDLVDYGKSAQQFISEQINDWLYQGYSQQKVDTIAKISRVHMSLIRELTYVSADLDKLHHNHAPADGELAALAKDEMARKQIVKRYLQRAMAMTGLMLLLARNKLSGNAHTSNVMYDLLRFKVEEYIERFIMRDDWSVHFTAGNSLATTWIVYLNSGFDSFSEYQQHIQNERKELLVNPHKRTRMRPMSEEDFEAKYDETHNAFTKNFPIHCQLSEIDGGADYSLRTELLLDFAVNFNPSRQRVLEKADIAFCRVLIADPYTEDEAQPVWYRYQDWCKDNHSQRLTPFHRVKVQLLVNERHQDRVSTKHIFSHLISYQVDDCVGPAFEVMFSPMSADEFVVSSASTNAECDDEIAQFYQQALQGASADNQTDAPLITGAQFEFSYWFGEQLIRGIRPVVNRSTYTSYKQHFNYLKEKSLPSLREFYEDIEANDLVAAWIRMHIENNILQLEDLPADFLTLLDESDIEWPELRLPTDEEFYEFYIEQGRLRTSNLRVVLLDAKQKVSFASDESMKYGVHREDSTSLSVVENGSLKTVTFPESIMLDNIDYMQGVTDEKAEFALFSEKAAHTYFACQFDGNTPVVHFDRQILRTQPDFTWQASKDPAKPGREFKIQVGLFVEDINTDEFDQYLMDWKTTSVELPTTLVTSRILDGIDALDSLGARREHGPVYRGDLIYCGEVSNDNDQWSLDVSEANPLNASCSRIAKEATDDLNQMRKALKKPVDRKTTFYSYKNAELETVHSSHHDLDSEKSYHLFVVEFDLSYVAPTGRNIKGLRPFGRIVHNNSHNTLEFNAIYQVGQQGIKYPFHRKIGFNLPQLDPSDSDTPWCIVEGMQPGKFDLLALQYWQRHSQPTECDVSHTDIVTDWILGQPSTIGQVNWHPRCYKLVQKESMLCASSTANTD